MFPLVTRKALSHGYLRAEVPPLLSLGASDAGAGRIFPGWNGKSPEQAEGKALEAAH